jgi:hypothetical protein
MVAVIMRKVMAEAPIRSPSDRELAVLRKLLDANLLDGKELQGQLPGLMVKEVDSEGSLELLVAADQPAPMNKSTAEVIASYSDIGNSDPFSPRVRLILHTRKGLLHELEFYKDDGSQILRPPEPDELLIEVIDPNC